MFAEEAENFNEWDRRSFEQALEIDCEYVPGMDKQDRARQLARLKVEEETNRTQRITLSASAEPHSID